MTATLTLDEDGRLFLPESVRHLLGLQPGAVLQAEVTARRIELRREEKNDDVPEITDLERTPDGTLVIPTSAFGKVDVVVAIKADREQRTRILATSLRNPARYHDR